MCPAGTAVADAATIASLERTRSCTIETEIPLSEHQDFRPLLEPTPEDGYIGILDQVIEGVQRGSKAIASNSK